MPNVEEMKTPNDKLAEEIVKLLFEKGFILEKHKNNLEAKLKNKSVSEKEWLDIVETTIASRKGDVLDG